jgi:hypothetical protein
MPDGKPVSCQKQRLVKAHPFWPEQPVFIKVTTAPAKT